MHQVALRVFTLVLDDATLGLVFRYHPHVIHGTLGMNTAPAVRGLPNALRTP